MFDKKIVELFQEIGEAKKAVLATSSNNRVTSRTMSFVIYENKFYCQTDKRFLKVEQILENPRVSICIDNIQIEGIAQIVGKPLEHNIFITLFKKYFKNSYENYSFLENEILLEINPIFITVWNYKEAIPVREFYDLAFKGFKEEIYLGDEEIIIKDKNKKLVEFLKNQEKERVEITYTQMEELLGRKLPKSAYEYQAYLSNTYSQPIPPIWLDLGYKQVKLVLGEYLILEKLK